MIKESLWPVVPNSRWSLSSLRTKTGYIMKKDFTEELKNLIKYIDELKIDLTDYKKHKSIHDPNNKQEYVDMELQLSAMNLYKLYLEKRSNRK